MVELLICALVLGLVWTFWSSIVVGIVAVAGFFHIITFYHWMITHPIQAAMYGSGYVLIGVLWSFYKWWDVQRTAFRKAKADWEKLGKNQTGFDSYIAEKRTTFGWKMDVDVVWAWITFWPLVLLWDLLNDPIRRIIKELTSVYETIANKAWS